MEKPTREELIKAMRANYEEMKELKANPTDLEKMILEHVKQLLAMTEDHKVKEELMNLLTIPQTKYPSKFVIPKDKVSNKLFDGALIIGEENDIATESKKSKKELTAKVSIDFDELVEVEGVQISKNLNSYDREVHDAIVSLYVDGENEYITPLMIYRTMTGNPKAKLTTKQQQAISDSVTKCSITRIRIDVKAEAEAYKMDKLIYEGNLIYTKKIIGEHKGQVGEWIYVMEQPILFDYAESKSQIDRPDINLLNTPVSKNEETIVLQGYLLRRIRTIKNAKARISNNILYETVYKQLNIEAASAGALRKKQTKIRNTVKEILDYWIKEKEIKGYKENAGKNNSIVSLTISI